MQFTEEKHSCIFIFIYIYTSSDFELTRQQHKVRRYWYKTWQEFSTSTLMVEVIHDKYTLI